MKQGAEFMFFVVVVAAEFFNSVLVFMWDCRVTTSVSLASCSTGTQICRAWCTNSTATWSSAWTLEETTNSCSMSCATSSKQVKVEIIHFIDPVTFSSEHTGAAAQKWHSQYREDPGLEETSCLIMMNVNTQGGQCIVCLYIYTEMTIQSYISCFSPFSTWQTRITLFIRIN